MPIVVAIAGPNGAGKSTAAPALLRDFAGVPTFVNADAIAQGLAAFDVKRSALQAGRVMIDWLDDLTAARMDFAFETTLSGVVYDARLRRLRASGYRCVLCYLWIPSADLCVARVAARVRLGGHNIPDGDIRRRYERSLGNFFRTYRPLFDIWRFFDNSDPAGQRLIAESVDGVETIHQREVWNALRRKYE